MYRKDNVNILLVINLKVLDFTRLMLKSIEENTKIIAVWEILQEAETLAIFCNVNGTKDKGGVILTR